MTTITKDQQDVLDGARETAKIAEALIARGGKNPTKTMMSEYTKAEVCSAHQPTTVAYTELGDTGVFIQYHTIDAGDVHWSHPKGRIHRSHAAGVEVAPEHDFIVGARYFGKCMH
jgi:hypothetical protein